MLTGFEDLVEAARRQTDGHFNEFGGTLSTEPNIFERVIRIFRSIWADGMGLYWPGRHWLTLLTTAFLISIYLFPLGISENKTFVASIEVLKKRLIACQPFLFSTPYGSS